MSHNAANSASHSASQSATSNSIIMRSRNMLAELFMLMRPKLKYIARQQMQRLPTCKDDESDVVQRSIEKALVHADQLKGKDSIQRKAWVIRIVRNTAKDTLRFSQQDKRAAKHEAHGSQVILQLEDKDNETPSKILDAEERQQMIDTALASLSIQQQQLIRWKLYQDLSYREIAERLKIVEPTASRRAKLAVLAFKCALERIGIDAIFQ